MLRYLPWCQADVNVFNVPLILSCLHGNWTAQTNCITRGGGGRGWVDGHTTVSSQERGACALFETKRQQSLQISPIFPLIKHCQDAFAHRVQTLRTPKCTLHVWITWEYVKRESDHIFSGSLQACYLIFCPPYLLCKHPPTPPVHKHTHQCPEPRK